MTERKEKKKKEDEAARAGWESRVTPLDFFSHQVGRPPEVKLEKRKRREKTMRKQGCRRRLPQ